MATKLVLGTGNPVLTSSSATKADKDGYTVDVEGPYELVNGLSGSAYCPQGYEVESETVGTTDAGMAKLTVRCIRYSSGGSESWAPVRTTFRVDMLEVQYDLEDHPHLAGYRDKILMWLATDEAERVDGNDFKYKDKDGNLQTMEANTPGFKFCKAYMAGLKTFNRYYPVIEKISYWKNPPGLNRFGVSFSSGSPKFSSNIGKFDSPPISLNGYAASKWFKSKDGWTENGNKTWTRTEQWTYAPEGSSSEHAWIYTELSN